PHDSKRQSLRLFIDPRIFDEDLKSFAERRSDALDHAAYARLGHLCISDKRFSNGVRSVNARLLRINASSNFLGEQMKSGINNESEAGTRRRNAGSGSMN